MRKGTSKSSARHSALGTQHWLHRPFAWLIPALAAGLLLGLTAPPVDAFWLSWVGLVPLLWALATPAGLARAFPMGWITGTVMMLFVLAPLDSADLWSGWELMEKAEAARMAEQRGVALTVLWIGVSAFIGLFWGVFAKMLAWISRGQVLRMLGLAPALLVLIPEWLRARVVWDSTWGFLGNTVIEVPGLLQLGALGGVWLLSAAVVVGNVAILMALMSGPQRQRLLLPGGVAAALLLAAAVGAIWQARLPAALPKGEGITVAALQHHQAHYRTNDYASIGLEKAYLQKMYEVAHGEPGPINLLVLPESISFVPLSLDGSRKAEIPDDVHRSTDAWHRAMRWAIGYPDTPFHLVLGMDTVEDGQLHNTLVFWGQDGMAGHYHKQGLVPFGEFQPRLLSALGIQGRVQYTPGTDSRIVDLDGLKVGSFICQEVVEPPLLRRSVRDGAQLLVSGGNDGVFTHPAVAEVNARLARLRAVETGRYIVRAMKTGISAVIAPTGEELAKAPDDQPYVAIAQVKALDTRTPYVRFGDWVLWVAGVLLLVGFVRWKSVVRAQDSGE